MSTNFMKAVAISLAASLATPVDAFWRMPCPGRLVLERIDPIISPGAVSGHVHTVSGGSGFGFSTSYEQQRASACTSCPIQQDLSAYWTPKLYYMSQDGKSFEDVPQAGEGGGSTGGLTVYYQQRGGANEKIKAFPPGLRFVGGDPFQRNQTNVEAAPGNAVSFVCLDYSGTSTNTPGMPNKKCPDGLRAQIYLPSCWDGIHNDTADHKSHMAYPIGHYDNGYCPKSHPVHLISIFYEVIYSTAAFSNRWYGSEHPFVFAQGDRTGYGFHGDFFNGWETAALQKAIDTCTDDSGNLSDCPVFNTLFSNDQCQACKIPPSVNEKVTGVLPALPGCNKPSTGPAYSPPQTCAAGVIGAAKKLFTDVTSSLKWEYVGCANDSVSDRTFSGASTSSNSMTVATCINFCKGKGYSLAGLQYASQCFCDNNYVDANRKPNPHILGNCWQPCAGDASETCGGSAALSVYKNCAGGACNNSVFTVNGTASSLVSGVKKSTKKQTRHIHGSGHAHGRAHLVGA